MSLSIEEMRALVSLPAEATAAQVVAAYAALVDDGAPASIEIVEPVTVEQARIQCRIDSDAEDSLIAQKISTAREWVEDYTSRILAQRTLVQHFRSFGPGLEIAQRPVVSIDAITYAAGFEDAVYTDFVYRPGVYPLRIFPASGSWPSVVPPGGVTVVYTAGYDPGEVPQTFIEAILVLVGGMLLDREGAYEASEKAAERLLVRLTRQMV